MKNCQALADKIDCNSLQKICKVLLNKMDNELLSELVSRRLSELRMSKSELARRLGLSRAYITDLANGTANTQSGQYSPSPEVIEGLAKHLQIDQSEILKAMGYTPTELDSEAYDILDLVRIQFVGGGKNISKKEQEKILEHVRIIAQGVLADEEKKKKEKK